jgi:hypothetical protein
VARLEGRSRFIFSGMDTLSRVSDVNRGTMLEELRINRRCGFTLSGNEGVNDFVVSRSVGRQPYNSRWNLISEIALGLRKAASAGLGHHPHYAEQLDSTKEQS